MQFDKHYTLNEANDLLPWVRKILGRVHQVSATLPPQFHLNPEHDSADLELGPLAPVFAFDHARALKSGFHAWVHDVAQVPDDAAIEEACRSLTREQKMELIGGLLQGVIEQGIVIQDIGRGLIDFPALAHDEEVLLCYELADGPKIVAWHQLNAGFAGREGIQFFPR